MALIVADNLFSHFGVSYRWYKGCLEGRVIFVKKYHDYCFKSTIADPERVCNGISLAAQVTGHKNALKLLGCCLETQHSPLQFSNSPRLDAFVIN